MSSKYEGSPMSELERVRDVLEAASLNKQDGYTVGEAINALNTHITQDKEREGEDYVGMLRAERDLLRTKLKEREAELAYAQGGQYVAVIQENVSLQSQLAELREAAAEYVDAHMAIENGLASFDLHNAAVDRMEAAGKRLISLIPTTPVRLPGLDPEHHQHADPDEGDNIEGGHDHDGLPEHFHRNGMVVNPRPTTPVREEAK